MDKRIAGSPEDVWLAGWRDVQRATKSAYTNLYMHAAHCLNWRVVVDDVERGHVRIFAPGREPFEIRKHHVGVLYHKETVDLCKDKKQTHELLLQHGFPCPRSVFVRRANTADGTLHVTLQKDEHWRSSYVRRRRAPSLPLRLEELVVGQIDNAGGGLGVIG